MDTNNNTYFTNFTNIITYIKENCIQILLVLLVIIIIIVVDYIAHINATLFGLPIVIPGLPASSSSAVKLRKKKK